MAIEPYAIGKLFVVYFFPVFLEEYFPLLPAVRYCTMLPKLFKRYAFVQNYPSLLVEGGSIHGRRKHLASLFMAVFIQMVDDAKEDILHMLVAAFKLQHKRSLFLDEVKAAQGHGGRLIKINRVFAVWRRELCQNCSGIVGDGAMRNTLHGNLEQHLADEGIFL